jgi:hypothetical protein
VLSLLCVFVGVFLKHFAGGDVDQNDVGSSARRNGRRRLLRIVHVGLKGHSPNLEINLEPKLA